MIVVRGLAAWVARGMLVPQPGTEPCVPCIERRIPYHWPTKEVSKKFLLIWLYVMTYILTM